MDAPFLRPVLIVGATVLAAVAVHVLVFRLLFRFGWRTRLASEVRQRSRWPARTFVAAVAAIVALPSAGVSDHAATDVHRVLMIVAIWTLAWLGVTALSAIEATANARDDLHARDNLRARHRQTQATVLRRVGSVGLLILAGAATLTQFPTARTIGHSILASAGIAGVVAGIAGRSTFGNLVAGIQIAAAAPIRLGDVVVIEGEWGVIEEITLTQIVVRIWDQRRLILPTSYVVENPFENWTRTRSQVLGTISLHLDHRTDVDALRKEMGRVVEEHELWDGDVWVLQVVDTDETTVHVRGLVSAATAPELWDLRCDVRERLLRWLSDEHPEALPVRRLVAVETNS